jgi:hypothetical protein
MDRAETAAKSIVETLINGAKMHYHTNQSLGEWDFDLEYPNRMKVPLEVTSATDQGTAATRAAILNPRHGGPFVSRGQCTHDWYVHPLPSANINKIRKHIASYLVAIEAEGRGEFFTFTDATESPAVSAILRDLKIEYGRVISWKSPGIGIGLPGDGGLVDPVLVNEVVETEALKSDNKHKLSAAAGSEKHLFVYLDGTTKHEVWAAARDEAPPAARPKLPPEITHIWMAALAGDGEWHTVWRAQNGSSWTHEGQVNIDTGSWRGFDTDGIPPSSPAR